MVCDESGIAKLLLWDEECTKLIGTSATEIHCNSSEKTHKIIEKALIGKKVLFYLSVNSEKDMESFDYYTVSRLAFDEEIMEIYSKYYVKNKDCRCDSGDILTGTKDSPITTMIMDKNQKKDDKGESKYYDNSVTREAVVVGNLECKIEEKNLLMKLSQMCVTEHISTNPNNSNDSAEKHTMKRQKIDVNEK
ncbi:hypothetical protein CASFOL_040072 [Castilleja foliolosa]|uniref:Replication factor A C-terminal domain-containing protein n=1 Tax=Castilleja foliolosa TaxID=1961234 RepID=A0ABD3BEG3_9LAMI